MTHVVGQSEEGKELVGFKACPGVAEEPEQLE